MSASARTQAIAEVRKSPRIANVLALLTSHRDHERDLGTHGIGAMQGRPSDDPQRAAHRETEHALDLLIEALS